MTRRSAAVRLLAVGSVAAGLIAAPAGCSTPATTADARLPGVHVRVLQYRSDIAQHRVQLQVVNASTRAVVVNRAVLEQAGFAPAPAWTDTDPAEIPAGGAVDLPAALSRASCAAGRQLQVRLTLRSGRTATVPATDVAGTLAGLRAEDCFAQTAADVLAAAFTGFQPVAGTRTARLELDLRAGPNAARGLTVTTVLPTTLLSPSTGDEFWRVQRRFTAAGRVTVTAEPTRCDLHAIAEDKVGSVLPVGVRLADGRTGTVRAAASPALRDRMLAWVASTCAVG